MIHIGFTGTRYGMTNEQNIGVAAIAESIFLSGDHHSYTAHHGDCIGADAEFDMIARTFQFCRIVVHPGPLNDVSRQAGCVGDERREPRGHLRRNADIVTESQIMIAAPFEDAEQERGGTWATIRMARKASRPLAIVRRDGRVDRERWNDVTGKHRNDFVRWLTAIAKSIDDGDMTPDEATTAYGPDGRLHVVMTFTPDGSRMPKIEGSSVVAMQMNRGSGTRSEILERLGTGLVELAPHVQETESAQAYTTAKAGGRP